MNDIEKQLALCRHKADVCQEAIKMLQQVNANVFKNVEYCVFRERTYACNHGCDYFQYCEVRLWFAKKRNAVNNLISDLKDQTEWFSEEMKVKEMEREGAVQWK